MRICDAAAAVLRESDNPAVMAGDSRLLHMICERAGRQHRGFRTEKLILDALSKQPGVLLGYLTRTPRGRLVRVFRLPEDL